MPLYEYVCKDCGQKFDSLRAYRDADQPIHCKNCESLNTRRSLSVFYAKGESYSTPSGGSCNCGNCSGGSCSCCNN